MANNEMIIGILFPFKYASIGDNSMNIEMKNDIANNNPIINLSSGESKLNRM